MRERVYEAGHIRMRAQRGAAAEHTDTVARPRPIVSRVLVYC